MNLCIFKTKIGSFSPTRKYYWSGCSFWLRGGTRRKCIRVESAWTKVIVQSFKLRVFSQCQANCNFMHGFSYSTHNECLIWAVHVPQGGHAWRAHLWGIVPAAEHRALSSRRNFYNRSHWRWAHLLCFDDQTCSKNLCGSSFLRLPSHIWTHKNTKIWNVCSQSEFIPFVQLFFQLCRRRILQYFWSAAGCGWSVLRQKTILR